MEVRLLSIFCVGNVEEKNKGTLRDGYTVSLKLLALKLSAVLGPVSRKFCQRPASKKNLFFSVLFAFKTDSVQSSSNTCKNYLLN